MTRELAALLDGQVVGRLAQDRSGDLHFEYDAGWREGEWAYPISLSMPLAQAAYDDEVVRPYLAGLLPDNERVLSRWGRMFRVSPNNPFALLAQVGEDCAGAVQFVAPARVAALRAAAEPEVQWLTVPEVAERLRDLRSDQAAWRRPGDAGHFSLAGAQSKIALLRAGDRWGIPAGRTPTTHIVKPPIGGLDGSEINEHICLRLARALGIPAAASEVLRFGDEVAIVVERYDRRATELGIARVHQEDFCQALAVMPDRKYESEGGPTAAQMIELLRRHSANPDEDVTTLLDALALNWAIGGSDAHAKNYSILFLAGGSVRLAPLYDVASALPYPSMNGPKLELAVKVGGESRLRLIARRHWERVADAAGFEREAVVARVRDLIQEIPDRLADLCRDAEKQGLRHVVLPALRSAVIENASRCLRALDLGRPAPAGG